MGGGIGKHVDLIRQEPDLPGVGNNIRVIIPINGLIANAITANINAGVNTNEGERSANGPLNPRRATRANITMEKSRWLKVAQIGVFWPPVSFGGNWTHAKDTNSHCC